MTPRAATSAETWVHAMVEDGFSFRLVAGGDANNPGDYNAHKGLSGDQSAQLLDALRSRRGDIVRCRHTGAEVVLA
jgi:hypothetical protein